MSRSIISLIILSGLLGCSGASKNLTTDVGTMAEGDRLKKDDFFEEARKQYQRIRAEFPQSPLQIEADLKIAETYYLEESYTASASAYEEFIRTYPGRPEIPKALYQLGMSYTEQMPSTPQRDTRPSGKAVDTFTRLIIDYPNSEYTEKAHKRIENARDQLAKKTFEIARFYERESQWAAAGRRYEEFCSQYPDHEKYEEAFARQIKSLRRAGHADLAESLGQNFREKFPKSKFESMIAP